MNGKAIRSKGARGERDFQKHAKLYGIDVSERNLFQVFTHTDRKQDLYIYHNELEIPVEVKNLNPTSANYSKFIKVLQESLKKTDAPFGLLAVHFTGAKGLCSWYITVIFKKHVGNTFLANQIQQALDYGCSHLKNS